MHWLEVGVFATSSYPIAIAWLSNRGTTLVHALSWAVAAWLGWLGAFALTADESAWATRYIALALTSCAAVAVLGARRPIAGAWNFVVLGLLAVLMLPLAENMVLRTPLFDPLRLVFMSATILVGVVNYLPTRFVASALLVSVACSLELFSLTARTVDDWAGLAQWQLSPWLLSLACWTAWFFSRRRDDKALFDREWLSFRDRFGLLWGQRVREQFNRAAANAGWTVVLRWSGLRKTSREQPPNAEQESEILEALRGLLKRFSANRD